MQEAVLYIYSTSGGSETIDTIKVVEGEFDWKTALAVPATFHLVFPNYSEQIIFAQPGESVKIKGDGGQLRAITIKGSPDNEEMTAFRLAHLDDKPDSLHKAMEAYIAAHEDSRVSAYLQRQLTQQRARASRFRVGQTLPAIVLPPDSEGGDTLFIRPKDKDAKPVLFVFWAAWKQGSTDAFIKIRKAVRANKNLQPISISLDNEKRLYRSKLLIDSIDYDRRCYFTTWNTPVVQQLAIRDIPYYILADSKRKILAIGSDWEKDIKPAVEKLTANK